MRALMWLVVILLLLSPGLWLAWKHQEKLETLFLGPDESAGPPPVAPPPSQVTALGRVEPDGGVIRIAGPSRFVVVVDELLVDQGDLVEKGQIVATLDSLAIEQAEVVRLKAELAHAEVELKRTEALVRDDLISRANLDRHAAERDIITAGLARAEAEVERSFVRSPVRGQVLEVHARSGEKVGPSGIVEIADTRDMIVVAEVHEADVNTVHVGRRAVVRSSAFPNGEIGGAVRRVALKVSRRDLLNSDPIADVDTRVVEVDIELDSPQDVTNLTNLRVEVAIDIAP